MLLTQSFDLFLHVARGRNGASHIRQIPGKCCGVCHNLLPVETVAVRALFMSDFKAVQQL